MTGLRVLQTQQKALAEGDNKVVETMSNTSCGVLHWRDIWISIQGDSLRLELMIIPTNHFLNRIKVQIHRETISVNESLLYVHAELLLLLKDTFY